MKRKAQGLSLNTIIIAAIVLIVLIVLWAIFTGRMGGFSLGLGTTQSCDSACNALNKNAVTCSAPTIDGQTTTTKDDPNYIGQYDVGLSDGKLADCCCS